MSRATKRSVVARTMKQFGLVKHDRSFSGLDYYVNLVVKRAENLVRKGKRESALDLIVHTLLPLRENEVLWLWHRDLFVYWSPKVHQFRAVRSEEVADLLRKLSFEEGVMIRHVLGHEDASEIIRNMFNRGPYSWPWARSIAYGLKGLGWFVVTRTCTASRSRGSAIGSRLR